MKIRLSDSDIRLRLTEFEVATVLEGRRIETKISQNLTFALVPSELGVSSVETDGGTHIVTMPTAQITAPSMNEPLIYESPSGQTPYILVEMNRPR